MASTNIETRLDKIDRQLDRIATVVVKRFDEVDKNLEYKADKADIASIINNLDAISKRQEISDDERLVMGHQLDRLNRWTQELANKIGYELTT